MRRAIVLGALLALGATLGACIDASRVNPFCRWTDGPAGKLDLARAADREHLRQDAQVAWEVGLRYADVRYRTNLLLKRPLLESCRTAMYDSIMTRHGVTRADIREATYARVWWVDVTFVFLPMLLVTALAMDAITRRIQGSFENERARLPALAASVGLVVMIAVGITRLWAMILESWRLRNEHISGRAFVVPTAAHPWMTVATVFALCLLVAGRRVNRRRLRDDPAGVELR